MIIRVSFYQRWIRGLAQGGARTTRNRVFGYQNYKLSAPKSPKNFEKISNFRKLWKKFRKLWKKTSVLRKNWQFLGVSWKIWPNFDRYSDFEPIREKIMVFFDFKIVWKFSGNFLEILGRFSRNGRYQNYKFREFPKKFS